MQRYKGRMQGVSPGPSSPWFLLLFDAFPSTQASSPWSFPLAAAQPAAAPAPHPPEAGSAGGEARPAPPYGSHGSCAALTAPPGDTHTHTQLGGIGARGKRMCSIKGKRCVQLGARGVFN